MKITPLVSQSATSKTPPVDASEAVSKSANDLISSDFETFLTMMTTQARYQDPLEPMDSSDYAAQLAKFSMVEQQVKSNDLLQGLTDALGSSDTDVAALAGWVGMDTLTLAPAHYDGTPITVSPAPLSSATKVEMVVYNETGAEVQRTSLPLSATPVQWPKTGDESFAPGTYTFEIESYQDDALALAERAQTYSTISEARIENDQAILVLKGGNVVFTSDVTGLRGPQ